MLPALGRYFRALKIAENTVLLSNLLQELELTANKAYLTELGLSELVALLKTANEECVASDNLKTIRPDEV